LHQAEKRLEQAAREWRTTFDSITDLISIPIKKTAFCVSNKAVPICSTPHRKELIGKHCHEVMHCANTASNCRIYRHWRAGKPAD